MEISAILLTSFFLFHSALCADACGSSSCGVGGPTVRFPFWLKDRLADRCGYPRFDLYCNNRNRTVLTLRFTTDLEVHNIDYAKQLIYLHCLPNQILNFTLSSTPFSAVDSRNFILSNLPRTVKYAIFLGAGIPGLVCLIGLSCFITGKIMKLVDGRRARADAEPSGPETNHGSILVPRGLDRPTIDSYPKTVLGESRRLPKPSDGTCPICLVDYQPKDTLRTIPECNHYFHAKCIDEWLRMNATCPLCRRSPPDSLVVTPSLSASISSASSPSSLP
ncbi:hypothetical protein NMG60_11030543 [Bertholletia excelsa]